MPEEKTTTVEENPPAGTSTTTTEEETLGEGGKRALEDERKARRDAEKRAAAVEKELDELRKKGLSEQERAVEEAKNAGKSESDAAWRSRTVRLAVKAAAGGKAADPGDIPALLGDLDRFVDDDGEVLEKDLDDAIEKLLKAKPYLRATATRRGSGDGGFRGDAPAGAGSSMTDLIRGAVRR